MLVFVTRLFFDFFEAGIFKKGIKDSYSIDCYVTNIISKANLVLMLIFVSIN